MSTSKPALALMLEKNMLFYEAVQGCEVAIPLGIGALLFGLGASVFGVLGSTNRGGRQLCFGGFWRNLDFRGGTLGNGLQVSFYGSIGQTEWIGEQGDISGWFGGWVLCFYRFLAPVNTPNCESKVCKPTIKERRLGLLPGNEKRLRKRSGFGWPIRFLFLLPSCQNRPTRKWFPMCATLRGENKRESKKGQTSNRQVNTLASTPFEGVQSGV